MNFYKDKIIFTGATGKFGKIFKDQYPNKNILYPSKKVFNIKNYNSVFNFLKKKKIKLIIHSAALSRPMDIHQKNPDQSIKTNIIGTANIVIACMQLNIKIIYFSTNYVYPSNKKNSKECDPILPINKYAVSKLGGECAVQMYNNSLILRIAMTEKPFLHEKAFSDVFANYLYHDEVALLIPKIINYKGILNIGGKVRNLYNFAKLSNPKVKKIKAKNLLKKNYYMYQTINTKKLNKLLNKKY